jgi:hypothetical protein
VNAPDPALRGFVRLDRVPDPGRLATRSRQFFERVFTTLAGELRGRLLARPVPPGDMPGDRPIRGVAGDVWAHCEVRAAPEAGDRELSAAYTAGRWAAFLAAVGEGYLSAGYAVSVLRRITDTIVAEGHPRLVATAGWEYPDCASRFSFDVTQSLALLDRDPRDEMAFLAVLRDVADEFSPAYGEVSNDHGGFSALEAELGWFPWTGVDTYRHTLRGYSWVTIVPEEIGDRLGGVPVLRRSGAFATAEALRNGGYWLQATRRFADYGDAAAHAVHRVLAPVLPAGDPAVRLTPGPGSRRPGA